MTERSAFGQDTAMPDPDLAALAESWLVHLRAERKSPATLRIYRAGVKAYLARCAENSQPAILDRNLLAAFTADLLDRGAEPATAQARHLAVRRFGRWLHAEGELAEDPLAGMRPPKLDAKVIPVLSDDQLRRLVKACEGKTLRDRRDEALVRLMLETGLRAGEVVALRLEDVDVAGGTLLVHRGKGGGGRLVPFSAQTARALDRYLRLRRGHVLADTSALWLGECSHGLGYDGLYRALRKRAVAAGIQRFSPHQLRHTAASRWLAAGGSEGGLMAIAGWKRREMLDRYAASTRASRAIEEARGLGLGEL
jgi:site-specific recombinase XerD